MLLLLKKNEVWQPCNDTAKISSPTCTTTLDSEEQKKLSSDSTLTIPSTSSEGLNVSENTWIHFKIPWEKLTRSTIDSLEKSQCDKQTRTKVVNVIVDNMLEVTKYQQRPFKSSLIN